MATGMRILLAWLILGAWQIASADALPDPTRPSIDLGSGSAVDVAPVEAATSHGLQSIIISPQHRAAIINGQMVQQGDKFGDATLLEVREGSVVLQNARGQRVMELFPKVSIKKNETAESESRVPENASGNPVLPENAAGGIK
jgi:MSHA biogenesis protein MshK